MPTSLRALVRGPRAGGPATPVEYLLLAVSALVLVGLVFFALGRLVSEQMQSCDAQVPATLAGAASAPTDPTGC